MKMLRALILLIPIFGCNGQIKEIRDVQSAYPTDANATQGLRVYMPALMRVTSQTTTVTDANKVTSYECIPHTFVQIQSKADYSTPLRIYYKPGLFETVTFGVGLTSDGVLSTVNANGAPPTTAVIAALPALITAAAAVLPAFPPAPGAAPRPTCTGDPIVTKIEKCTDSTVCAVN
jgi:hypothetical protein